ncbi:cytochrome P450 [Aaosphaeria arxii CBS 175.79]|uniref:Cytochrome P450 n=1 Tax=Aaosphaeria arxii CBS 175.79 TaxID=1450172 RepID=A0A6A5XKZ9_9PLEO|nr:cytochrome P450 [Aaosphaeria arxii CBS 175.79]KAF2013541.1 cytochrome P450 [Aaosphaeria arxii CBS 175.79]
MSWTAALVVVALTTASYLFHKTYVHRSRINDLRKQGIPMPKEWSWFTGHLLTLQKYVNRLPPDANVNLAMRDLALEFADTEVFLMDFWPVYPPLLVVYDPDAAVQITTKYNLPKTDMHLQFMRPITGGPNLISMSDQEWKIWRSLFNPGFSSSVMMENVPHIIDKVQIFFERLKEGAKNGIVSLDSLTTSLTMDVIVKLTLDADLDCQRSESALVSAMNNIIAWHSFWDPRILMHPFRPLVQRYYGRVMNTHIRKELIKRFNDLKQAKLDSNKTIEHTSGKSVIALAIEAYIKESQQDIRTLELDEHFARYATYQTRLFLFAGNDTTSSTIVYVFHLLSQHPEALKKLRDEHDTMFGTDANQTPRMLKEEPALLNKCSFTLAVIKETLRLYPPAATMRAGRNGVSITDRHGNIYPMDYVGATILHPAVHSNPRVWVSPEKFIPERFLVGAEHDLYVNTAAYRPFEQGPRNCIGQTLVYNEIRTVMVMVARSFDIVPAYDEWDAIRERQMCGLARLKVWAMGKPVKTVHGDRAYQTEKAGTHPADGYPCHVSSR